MSIPTEQEVLEYFKSLSNWGRWGDDDQLGTPNLITPEKTKKAIATVQEGVTVSLSRTVLWDPAPVFLILRSIIWWKVVRDGLVDKRLVQDRTQLLRII